MKILNFPITILNQRDKLTSYGIESLAFRNTWGWSVRYHNVVRDILALDSIHTFTSKAKVKDFSLWVFLNFRKSRLSEHLTELIQWAHPWWSSGGIWDLPSLLGISLATRKNSKFLLKDFQSSIPAWQKFESLQILKFAF